METLHLLNIIVHVVAGSLALAVGIVAALVNKRSRWHVRWGQCFMWLVVVVIATALAGVFVFQRNNFLLVITLLSGYTCFSGIRAIRLRGEKPALIDRVVPIVVMASAFYYLYHLRSIGLYWAPVVTYSTIGALFLVTTYDLLKNVFPAGFRKKAVLYEHVYKMFSAWSALASAFSGTVFPQYKPYSQFLPSVLSFACVIVIFIGLATRRPALPGNTLS